jgi:hemin uptake protein HemP
MTGHTDAPPSTPAEAASVVRRLDSLALLKGEREIVIVHRGQEYRLRVTRAQKLILTK